MGHLFQGRYKAILYDKDAYLLELVRYIHLNPVRAKIVREPEDYMWTGHLSCLGKEPFIDRIEMEKKEAESWVYDISLEAIAQEVSRATGITHFLVSLYRYPPKNYTTVNNR